MIAVLFLLAIAGMLLFAGGVVCVLCWGNQTARRLAAFLGALLLVAIAAFCLFGLLATFEPTVNSGMWLGFRIGYAVVGGGCLMGALALLLKGLGPARPGGGSHGSHGQP